jgi:hypothetical protein
LLGKPDEGGQQPPTTTTAATKHQAASCCPVQQACKPVAGLCCNCRQRTLQLHAMRAQLQIQVCLQLWCRSSCMAYALSPAAHAPVMCRRCQGTTLRLCTLHLSQAPAPALQWPTEQCWCKAQHSNGNTVSSKGVKAWAVSLQHT